MGIRWNPTFCRALKSPKKFSSLYFVSTCPCPGPFLLLLLGVEEGDKDSPSVGPVRALYGAQTCMSM